MSILTKIFHLHGLVEEAQSFARTFIRLDPMDFFFWGVLKDKVYSQKPRIVNDLKNHIREAFHEINAQSDLCEKVCRNVRDRFQSCVNQEGKQFEHLGQ